MDILKTRLLFGDTLLCSKVTTTQRLRLLEVNTVSVLFTTASYKLVLLVHIVSTTYMICIVSRLGLLGV